MEQFFKNFSRKYQYYLDRTAPQKMGRWIGFAVLLVLFFLRIIIIQSHFLVTYVLSIYLLHGLIGFCTPQEESIPDPFDNIDDDVYVPQQVDDEFRPFMRRLPEFDFWFLAVRLVLLAFFTTFFDLFDIPVFVPILVIYFLLISLLTAKNLYRHMKKYNYNPFLSGKETFKNKE
ncbi:Golgi proteins involved in ER retention (RER) [Pseudoloma neurophilia]|uniref:Protein RER1 n=1 Tax=Pseudoloma neurophilia TaxID=146866 RepID=A0A0R0M5K0_9MICR|nr:Golgi proteins involved in ER retention (RER) [Pseudoloma neurophilia]